MVPAAIWRDHRLKNVSGFPTSIERLFWAAVQEHKLHEKTICELRSWWTWWTWCTWCTGAPLVKSANRFRISNIKWWSKKVIICFAKPAHWEIRGNMKTFWKMQLVTQIIFAALSLSTFSHGFRCCYLVFLFNYLASSNNVEMTLRQSSGNNIHWWFCCIAYIAREIILGAQFWA